MNQIAKAAEFALTTCPRTSWTSQPIYDHAEQRLSLGSMKEQLIDDAQRARARVFVMLIQWALTGEWPKLHHRAVFFVREILSWSAAKKHFVPETDFPDGPPPWKPKYVAHFFDRTALVWYTIQCDRWAREIASDAFDLQEANFRMMNPLE